MLIIKKNQHSIKKNQKQISICIKPTAIANANFDPAPLTTLKDQRDGSKVAFRI